MYVIILNSLSKLTELSELRLTRNNFSKGLPSVVEELSTLKVLHLDGCQLVELPVRYVHCIHKFIFSGIEVIPYQYMHLLYIIMEHILLYYTVYPN